MGARRQSARPLSERGKRLALVVEETLGKVPLARKIFADDPPGEASREELEELGEAARIDRIPGMERDALLAAVIPEKPLATERARTGTYAALLLLAKQKGAMPTEADLFNAAGSLKRFGEPVASSGSRRLAHLLRARRHRRIP